MGQVLVSEQYLESIANSLRSQLETERTFLPEQMAMGVYDIPVGGVSISGIEVNYSVAKTNKVIAGDFVSLVNSFQDGYASHTLSTLGISQMGGYPIVCIPLTEKKIAILYGTLAENASAPHISGAICTISSSAITVGTPQVLISNEGYGSKFWAAKIEENKIFLVYRDNSYNLYATRLEVSNNSFQILGSAATLPKAVYFSGEVLSNSKVLVPFNYPSASGNTFTIKVASCSISGTGSISSGTYTVSQETERSSYFETIKCCVLSSSKAIVLYSIGNFGMNVLYATIFSFTSSTVKGTKFSFCADSLDAVTLDENNVLVATIGGRPTSLYIAMLTIDGTTISIKSSTQVSTSGSNVKIMIISESTALVSYIKSGKCESHVFTFSDTDITLAETKTLSNSAKNTDTAKLKTNKAFIVTSTGQNYDISAAVIDPAVKPKSGNNEILGVAKTNGTAGEISTIYLPNREE